MKMDVTRKIRRLFPGELVSYLACILFFQTLGIWVGVTLALAIMAEGACS